MFWVPLKTLPSKKRKLIFFFGVTDDLEKIPEDDTDSDAEYSFNSFFDLTVALARLIKIN